MYFVCGLLAGAVWWNMSAVIKKNKFDLTKGSIMKTMALYGIPILVAQLIMYLYNLADTMIIGQKLGSTYMGAVGASGTTSGILFSLVGGMTAGFAVIIGISFGSGDKEKTKKAVLSAELLSLLFGIFITVLGLCIVRPLLKVTNFPEDKIEIGYRYLIVIFAGSVISVFNNMHTTMLRTLGDSRSPVYILTASAFVNIGLNLIFVNFTQLKEIGVALATVISQLVSAIIALVLFLRNFPEFNFFKKMPWEKKLAFEQIKMGVPMAFQNSMIMIGAVIVQTAVNQLETSGKVFNAMASYVCANSINNISSTLINTFGMVIAGFVSQNYGAKDFDRIKKGIWSCLVLSWIISILLAFILVVFDRTIVSWFTDEFSEELYFNVHRFMIINVAFYPIWVPVPILRNAIQSMKDSLLPFLSCLVELPMRCITAWVFSSFWGFDGISFATPTALVAAFVFLMISFFLIYRKKKRQIEQL